MDKNQKIKPGKPDYRKIYEDLINKEFLHKKEECRSFFEKQNITALDILQINNQLFGLQKKDTEVFNQNHRSYDVESILRILQYQEKYSLNNTELANKFKISRNTVAKWKKIQLK